MRRSLLPLTLTLVTVVGTPVRGTAEQMVAFMVKPGFYPPYALTLHRIEVSYDPQAGYTAGQPQPLPVGPLGISVSGISLAPGGRLLGVNAANNRLVEIDTGTGLATPLVDLEPRPPSEVHDIAVDPAGRGWLVARDASEHDILYQFDLATGEAIPVGETHLGDSGLGVGSLTWLDGTLYALSQDLYSIDPTTAQATLIAPGGGGGPWASWWFMSFGSDTHSLWYVACGVGEPGPPYHWDYGPYDLATGERTPLGGWLGDFDWAMIEVLPIGGADAPIPALGPVGVAVLVLALGAAGVVLLRRLAV